MSGMPRPRPPHLHRETTRHGRAVWYVRVGRGPRVRLRAAYGTPEFEAEYRAAVSGAPLPAAGKPGAGTLAWVIARYRESTAWLDLSPATRKQREAILKQVVASAGNEPVSRITKAAIIKGRERRKATPAQARHFVRTMAGLFRWARDADLATVDPTEGVSVPSQSKEGHLTWTDEDCASFESRWPVGTRERVAYAVLLYTGLRRGDAVVFGRQHVKAVTRNLADGTTETFRVGTIKTEKTGEWVTFRISAELEEAIASGPIGDLAYIAGEKGRPMTKEAFGNWFRRACQAAGVPGTAHGLRKALATRYADRGASESELDARFGWSGGKMAAHYTRKANRKRLALQADEREENGYSRTSRSGAGGKSKRHDKSTA